MVGLANLEKQHCGMKIYLETKGKWDKNIKMKKIGFLLTCPKQLWCFQQYQAYNQCTVLHWLTRRRPLPNQLHSHREMSSHHLFLYLNWQRDGKRMSDFYKAWTGQQIFWRWRGTQSAQACWQPSTWHKVSFHFRHGSGFRVTNRNFNQSHYCPENHTIDCSIPLL